MKTDEQLKADFKKHFNREMTDQELIYGKCCRIAHLHNAVCFDLQHNVEGTDLPVLEEDFKAIIIKLANKFDELYQKLEPGRQEDLVKTGFMPHFTPFANYEANMSKIVPELIDLRNEIRGLLDSQKKKQQPKGE